MFCEKCGANINEGEQFCSVCGAKVGENEISEEIIEQVSADAESVSEEQPKVSEAETVTPAADDSEPLNSESTVFCNNCGNKMNADEVFCSVCGARSSFAPDTSYTYEQPDTDKKPAIRKPLVLAAALIIVIGVVSIVASAFPYVSNAVAKLVMSPDDYFVHVVNNSFDDIADNITKTYSVAMDNMNKNKGAKGEISLALKEDFSDAIEDATGEDVSEYIGWLENAAITYEASVKDNTLSQADLGVKLNNKNLGKISVITDLENQEMYMGLPDYNSDYIYVDMADSYEYGYNPYEEMTEAINSVMKALPDDKLLNKLLCTYVTEIAKSVEDVDESKEKLEADGVSQKVTVLSAEITEETIFNAGKNILTRAKDDKNFKKLIESLEEIEDADIDYDEIIDSIEETLEYMEEYDSEYSSDESANLEVYINGKGKIIGFSVEYEDNYDSFEISAYTVKKGSKYGTYLGFNAGMVSVTLEGKGKESFGKRSGEFVLDAAGNEVVTLELKGVDINKLDDGIFKGTLTVRPAEDAENLLSMYAGSDAADFISELALVIKSDSKSLNDSDYKITVQKDGKDLAELGVSAKTQNSGKISIPSDYIDMSEYGSDEEYFENFDIDALINKLKDANLPDEAIDALEYEFDY